MKTKIVLSVLTIAGILILSGCGCKSANPHKYNLTLEIWGILDSREALDEALKEYQSINPNVAIVKYKKIPVDTYKKELTDALAAGQGPDIFMIHNDWLPGFANKIVPAPEAQSVINEQKFRENFVDVAAADFIDQGKVYAAPLSVNTLGLYYNKDLFNQAGITAPPKTWDEFITDVKKLTVVDAFNEITQAGAAIGTAYNINRSTDILNLLMFQNNTEMIDERGVIKFDSAVAVDGKSVLPGKDALDFYTQFAKSGSLSYTWNPRLHYSLDAFSEGTVGMMFNYSWHIKTIADKSPKLNFAVAPVPQPENGPNVNYANYWAYAVSKNKTEESGNSQVVPVGGDTRVEEAWKLLTYLTTKPDGTFTIVSSGIKIGKQADVNFDPAKSYLEKSGEPAARRDIIEIQKIDPSIGVFAADNLIAKSWKQSDPAAIESIFAEMIDQVNKGQFTVPEAIKAAARRVQILSQ